MEGVMARVYRASDAVRDQVREECTALMQELAAAISERHGVSLLSSATILQQVSCIMLEAMGGKASRGFMAGCLEAQFLADHKKMSGVEKRCMAQMQKMADHFDLLTSQPGGSA
jgi:hypothetical protein